MCKIFGSNKDYECLAENTRDLNTGSYLREVRSGSCLGKGASGANGSHRVSKSSRTYLVLKSLPSRIGLLMDMTLRDIERVLYFESFVPAVDPG